MSDSFFRQFCFASCLESVVETKTNSIKTKSITWFEWEAGLPNGLVRFIKSLFITTGLENEVH